CIPSHRDPAASRWRRRSAGRPGSAVRVAYTAVTVRVLVTGGAGFIGSHFVRTLLGGGFPGTLPAQVTGLDKLTYSGVRVNLDPVVGDPRLRFVEGDICDPALVDDLLPGHDAVVHFAAESHVDRSIQGAAPFVITNVLGTQNLLDAALRHGLGR